MLDTRRSLGSVIKLLTPSREYTDEYNAWLSKIPSHIYAMAFIIKRFYKEEWQGDCPPLKALLEIMANGTWNGKSAHDPEFRAMFNRESVLQSDWYQARLVAKQQVVIWLAKAKLEALEGYCAQAEHLPVVERLGLRERLNVARQELERLSSHEYLFSLNGSIGVDPVLVG
ncbi:MAG: hypothetical protein ACKO9Q_00085 [Pirellula sp.]